jgi:transposase
MRLIGMEHPAPLPIPPALTAEQLPDDVATLKRMILELLASLREQGRDYEAVRHRLNLLLQRLFGRRNERFDPSQLLFFDDVTDGQEPAPATEASTEAQPRRRAKPHGRRRLPHNLPREPRHHELTEAERLCAGCGQARVDIGTDKSEQLDYRPASLFVIEHFVHKYVCAHCSKAAAATAGPELPLPQEAESMPAPEPQPATRRATPAAPVEPEAPLPQETGPLSAPEPQPVDSAATTPASTAAESDPAAANPGPADQGQQPPVLTSAGPLQDPGTVVIAAAKPPPPIAKGLPGPGLLAHLIVSKYVDHLPLHRLERVYERQGLFLPRSTLCDWLAACAQLLRPLYQRLIDIVLQSRALHTDDTPVKMQEQLQKQEQFSHLLRTTRLWAYLGDATHPYNVFDFTLNRQRDGPRGFLATYQGYLHADAFTGYDCLYLPDPRTATARIVEVACNAHARRKFYEARSTDALRSHRALAYYGQLYELERAAKDFTEGQRLHMRQELAVPILNQFHDWLVAEHAQVLPKSPMREALGYALHNWPALTRYTEAGFLAIDNNAAEREMKRIAIGRKNWLFVGSPQGGQTAAVLLSFTSTCQRLGVEPWAYLQDVLTRLPGLPTGQLDELLPDRGQGVQAAANARATSTP